VTRRVEFTRRAEDQLLAIFLQIATAASEQIAARYADAIMRHCQSLSTFPVRGAQRDDIRPGMRVFGFRRRVQLPSISPKK